MVDTVKTIAVLLTELADNTSGAVTPQVLRDVLVTLEPKCAQLTDSTDQAVATINTPQVILFDNVDVVNGFTHSGGEVTVVDEMPALSILLEAEVNNGSGANTMTLWMEIDTGAGFVGVANSAEEVVLSSNSEGVVVLQRLFANINVGDKFRCMMQGTSTNLNLNATAANGPIPAIPSVVLNVVKL